MDQYKIDNIKAAQAFAKKEVREFLDAESILVSAGRGSKADYLWWHLNLSWADGAHGSYIAAPNDCATQILCDLALIDEGVRGLVCQIIATRIHNKMPLADPLRKFAYLAIQNLLPKCKSKPGPKASRLAPRDNFLIYTLVELTDRFGLTPSHSDQKSPQKEMRNESPLPSGAEILSRCFCDYGRHEVTPRAIIEVWFNKEKRQLAAAIDAAIDGYKEPPVNALSAPRVP